MSEKNKATAVAYYTTVAEKRVSDLEKYLHADVECIGPLGHPQGKQAVLEAIKNFISFFNTLAIRATFAADNQVMMVYDVTFPPPIGVMRTASLLTFQDGLIAKLELFFDARPIPPWAQNPTE